METALNITNIYNENHSKVLNHINGRIKNDKETAEEITNDVFMRIDKHIDNYDAGLSSFNTWMFNIVNRMLIDHWRKKSLITLSINKEDSEGREMFEQECIEYNPHQILVNTELGDKISNAIAGLPKKYVRITEMFFIKGYSYQEIQDELEIPNGTVKGMLFRSRALLRNSLS